MVSFGHLVEYGLEKGRIIGASFPTVEAVSCYAVDGEYLSIRFVDDNGGGTRGCHTVLSAVGAHLERFTPR